MAVALLVAAGRGERLGAGVAKALVPLAGRPMLQWSLDALRAVPAIEQVIVAMPPGTVAPDGVAGVEGGQTRSESVARALRAAGPGEPVLVHDAARPLVTPELIQRLLDGLEDADAAIAAAPVADTIKRVSAERVVLETPPRAELWAVQTPQVFRRAALERALLSASEEVLATATDDAWLIEQTGGAVQIVPATPRNLKVTSPTDLRLAELLLAEGTP